MNAPKRLNFAKERYNKPIFHFGNRHNLELRAEIWIELKQEGKKYVWREKGDAVKHGGCFNFQVGNLTIIDGRLTAAKYTELSNENWFRSIERFEVGQGLRVSTWNSWQIFQRKWYLVTSDPMEHPWDELERQIPENTQRYTKSKFVTAIRSKTNEIDSGYTEKN